WCVVYFFEDNLLRQRIRKLKRKIEIVNIASEREREKNKEKDTNVSQQNKDLRKKERERERESSVFQEMSYVHDFLSSVTLSFGDFLSELLPRLLIRVTKGQGVTQMRDVF